MAVMLLTTSHACQYGSFCADCFFLADKSWVLMRILAVPTLVLAFVVAWTCTTSGAGRRDDTSKADKPQAAATAAQQASNIEQPALDREQQPNKTEEGRATKWSTVPNSGMWMLAAFGAGCLALRQVHQWRRPRRKRDENAEG